MAGPDINLRKGRIYDIKSGDAKAYIKAGVARELTELETQIEKLKEKEAKKAVAKKK